MKFFSHRLTTSTCFIGRGARTIDSIVANQMPYLFPSMHSVLLSHNFAPIHI